MSKKQKYLDDIEKDRSYNLETLDSSLLKYSAVGAGLFPCIYGNIYNKFCNSSVNVFFVLGISFLFISMLSQLFSFKISTFSQSYYLLFFSESDEKNKLKAYRRFEIFHYIHVFLDWAALCFFAFACISLTIMFWVGLL